MKVIKRQNRKGFTLIELLAVITILAIIMLLAARSVTSVLTSAQRRTFVIDAQNIVESAKLAYTQALLENKTGGGTKFCMSIAYLKDHGLEKNGVVEGSVLVDVSSATAKYKIWLSNDNLMIEGEDLNNLNEELVKPIDQLTNFNNCGGEQVDDLVN